MHSEREALTGREREWWAKVPAHVLRLAGALSLVSWALRKGAEPEEILWQYVEAAETLVLEYFWPHSRACLRQIGVTQRHADARMVLRWIRARGVSEVRREDVRRDALSQRLDADETDAVLQQLVRAGWLQRQVTSTGKVGRPTVRWQINPKLVGTEE